MNTHILKEIFKNKVILFAVIILISLICIISLQGTYAEYSNYGYRLFFDGDYYEDIEERYKIDLNLNTFKDDKMTNQIKSIRLGNIGTYPVFVRVKLFYGNNINIENIDLSTSNWSINNNGYYYYDLPIYTGNYTNDLKIKINNLTTSGKDFNFIYIYEYSPVLIDNNGNEYANWNNIITNVVEDE